MGGSAARRRVPHADRTVTTMSTVDWDALALCLDGKEYMWIVEAADDLSYDRNWWEISMVVAQDVGGRYREHPPSI